ncbi:MULTISPECIES: ShlB/FhaC/HecB family hemolysin secretion/activation protein [Falsihalocynthiibacter]|uniref:ShlB/FhaC/HecB family hemolysin secretion/activation protein n=1 Tax=Falsihalocynthiibacter TaxID=2854182 RepID=UPI003001722B
MTCLVGAQALAQTASEITPDTFQPPLQRLTGAIVFSGQSGTEAPAGSEKIEITLSGVDLQDGLRQMAKENAAFEARLTRGRIPVSELFEATADLEAAYANAGYVLARVVLPQQTLNNGGRLKVTVVNGFIEAIDSTNVAPNIRARLELLTAPLVDQPGLTRAELESQLLLAGDMPGVALQSALAAGELEGGAIIALDPEFRPFTGFIGFGNPYGEDLGGNSLNMGFEINSPFKFGETFYARLSGAPGAMETSDPRNRIFAIGAVVPLGYSGLTINVEATQSETNPDVAFFPTQSTFERNAVRLAYPFIRSLDLNVSGLFALDMQTDQQSLRSGPQIYEDRLSILRLGGTVSKIHDSGATSFLGLTVSQGIDAFGARVEGDAGYAPSRAGANAIFTKLNGAFSYLSNLSESVMVAVYGRFQTSFGDPLPTSEQFSLVGPTELSAFDSGELRGDSGWVLHAEVSTLRQVSLGETPLLASPYLFAGFGQAFTERPTFYEQSRVNAFVYGVGTDLFTVNESNFRSDSLRIEFGRGSRDDGKPDDYRFSITANSRF